MELTRRLSFAWIDNYCRAKPLDQLEGAAGAFVFAHLRSTHPTGLVVPLQRHGIRWPARWDKALCRHEAVWAVRREIKRTGIPF
jgi:hypothetical protein